jgi:pilus assembly protein Flp/PilA
MTLRDKFDLTLIQTLLKREEGQTMAEYGILVAVIALIAIVGATFFGNSLSTFFNGLSNSL